jgi:nitrate reductase NapAB chaperone NapD
VHLSGILVLADTDRLDACRRDLESLPGVEVHLVHRPSGRMIAVLESATLAGQTQRLRRIQELPAVRLAALVEHRIEEPPMDEDVWQDRAVRPASEG